MAAIFDFITEEDWGEYKLIPLGLALGLRKATGEGEGRKNFPLAAPIPFPFDYTKVPSFLQFNMAVLNKRKHGATNENACKASYLRRVMLRQNRRIRLSTGLRHIGHSCILSPHS